MTDDDVDPSDLADLAVVEPGEFVAARNARVKELRAGGERERAAAAAKLRKPTWTAWALNVLAREEPDAIAAWLAAGDSLDDALAQAPGGDRDLVRTAQQGERAALGDAVDRADAVLVRAGRAMGDQDRQRLTGTLRAAVTDADVRDRLVRGVLVDDVEAPTFGFGFGVAEAAPVVSLDAARAKRAAAGTTKATGRGATKKGAKRASKATEVDADDEAARIAAEEAEAAEAEARAEAERLAAERARLVAERDARQAELDEREAAATAADDAVRVAEDAARLAHDAVEIARAALTEVRAALDALGPDAG